MTGKTKLTEVSKKVEENEEEDSDEEVETRALKKQFVLFIKAKNPDDPGTHIVLSQSDHWMKHAGVIRGRQLTTTDTGVCYFKFKKYKLTFQEFVEFLEMLAAYKNIPVSELIEKLINCGPPPQEGMTGLKH
ncbi:hypothetical protein RUM43_013480 [Polyplax serrata]|uniref:Uncharacterized protein n=1 Tax=Polyplax serrata TaxID=468196 RepID=A0AAN8Q2U3_POLSC